MSSKKSDTDVKADIEDDTTEEDDEALNQIFDDDDAFFSGSLFDEDWD